MSHQPNTPTGRRLAARIIGGAAALAVAGGIIAPANPAPAAAAGCSVNAILVPSCGAWAGASAPAKGGHNPTVGVQEYESIAKSVPDILHFYESGGGGFPSKLEISLAQRAGKQPSILFHNWQPAPNLTWRQIASGAANSAIDSVANSIKAYPHKIMLAIAHEPENDMKLTSGSGKTPEDYAAMFRYVVNRLRSQGVRNAVFVWNVMGFSGHAAYYDRLYPGNDVVDWIAWDAYGHKEQANFTDYMNRPAPSKNWPGMYTWATKKAPGKPLMLGEWAYDIKGQPNAPQIIKTAANVLKTQYPMVKAMVYWNSTTYQYSFRLDQNTTVGKAYGAAYSQMVADPYFNQTATTTALSL
jgi:beta-mannanase